MTEILDNSDFNLDVSDLNTARPILPARDYTMEFTGVEIKPNKKETGRNLVCQFKTIEKHTSLLGDEVPAGLMAFKYFPMQPNPEKVGLDTYDPEGFKKDMTIFLDALYNVKSPTERPRLNFAAFHDKLGTRLLVPLTVENDKVMGQSNGVNNRGIKAIEL